SLPDSDERDQADAAGDACRQSNLGVTDTRLRGDDGKEGVARPRRYRRWLLRQQRIPALIPQEVAGTSRQYPLNLATRRSESPAVAGNPRLSRSARKRQDRPVTPEVAGSSPVAPVKALQISY